MRLRLARTLLGLPILGLLSCSKPPDISGELEEYANLLNAIAGETCECPDDAGFATVDECVDVLLVDADERACQADAFEGHEDAGKDYLDCAIGALDDYLDCLSMNPGCAVGWWDDCTTTYQDAEAACPRASAAVQDQFSGCLL
ncbi:MAG: hypothetical protein KC457_29490 [Myxococcales bacterium]|nr:hypothetical protein [Myxococcales bacterium]